MNIILRASKIKEFLGPRVWIMLWCSVLIGIVLFLVESSFVIVLQLFLFSLGLISTSQLIVPAWLPRSQSFAIALLLIFGIARGGIYMIKSYVFGLVGEEFIKLQRLRTIEYGLSEDCQFSTSQIVNVFTERVNRAGVFLQSILQLLLVLTSASFFFAAGLKLAPLEMLIGVFSLGLCLIPIRFLNVKISKSGIGLREEWSFVSSTLISGLRNNFFLRVYNLVDTEVKKAATSLERYLSHYRKYYVVSTFKSFLPNVVGIIVVCVITFVSLKFIHTKGILLVSFFYLFIRFAQAMSEANSAYSEMTLHRLSFQELYTWALHHKEYKEKFVKTPIAEMVNLNLENLQINIEDVSFSYDGNNFLFKNIYAGIKTGEMLLIKGPSGSGKSTLLMIILGMLKPNTGRILINNLDVQKLRSSLSRFVGYVGPEPYLTIGTIKENLLFGHEFPLSVTDNQLCEAMKLACLDTNALPLDFYVKEQASLSTGQKQRISIARSLIRKPKLLVLDEATANLDIATELKFLENLKTILPQMLVVVISHKSSFDSLALNVLNLENISINNSES